MAFDKLDDSPMFREQIQLLEESAESLRERSLKFYKGCRKYTEGLGEAYDGDIAFASSLEMFGGGHGDPVGVAFGGPVMTKFTIALREIGTYKEVLHTQVENILNEKLLQFVNFDLFDVKEARKRFDKSSILYDQARERYLSLKKGTKKDITTAMEEELYNARSSFEQARFTLVSALSNVEAKKKFEFLEAVGRTMDAHLHYFKQGYELLQQMEPYTRQVLTYAQQSKERSEDEQAALSERMKEFKRKIDRESRWPLHGSPTGDGMQVIGRRSNKQIEVAVRTAASGKVQVIRQGYLSKRSSNLRGDWKRRFFVLDSKGMLYYYRKQYCRPPAGGNSGQKGQNPSEFSSGLLSRWLSSHYHGGVHDENSVARHTVNLLTSTIKVDADQSDLRFCFRVISPSRTYTLQAESTSDQMDWIEKITGVIASLLSSQPPKQHLPPSPRSRVHLRSASESNSFGSLPIHDHSDAEDCTTEGYSTAGRSSQTTPKLVQRRHIGKTDNPIEILRKVPGNHVCADCSAPEPEWASLNLGILLCIECSGVHRNLGVHISKVRSLTLDVKVWEPSIINLLQSLGNTFANSIWEELLPEASNRKCRDASCSYSNSDERKEATIRKPVHTASISVKEKFIHAKYAEKLFVQKLNVDPHVPVAKQMWDSIHMNDKQSVYHHIVASAADVNTVYEPPGVEPPLTDALPQQEKISFLPIQSNSCCAVQDSFPEKPRMESPSGNCINRRNHSGGLSLLHIACISSDIGMVELLLQYGANTNATDMKGQTPLHHCIMEGKSELVKLLIKRGAEPGTTDKQGKTPLQNALELQSITDEEVLFMLEDRRTLR